MKTRPREFPLLGSILLDPVTVLQPSCSLPVSSISWHPEGTHLAAIGNSRHIEYWPLPVTKNAPPPTPIPLGPAATKKMPAGREGFGLLAWHPSGKWIVSGTVGTELGDYGLQIQSFPSGEGQIIVKAHEYPIVALCWNPAGSLLATRAANEVVLWEFIRAGTTSSKLLEPSKEVTPLLRVLRRIKVAGTGRLRWTRDGSLLACCLDNKGIVFLDDKGDRTGHMIPFNKTPDDYHGFSHIAWSPDRGRLAAVQTKFITILTVPPTTNSIEMPQDNVRAVDWSADGRLLASAGWKFANVWNPANGQALVNLRMQQSAEDVAWHPTKSMLAIGERGRIHILRVVAGPRPRIRSAQPEQQATKPRKSTRAAPKPTEFDVFVCYSQRDEATVADIAERLTGQGLRPWFAPWELQPGHPWQPLLEAQISRIHSAAVFVGKGTGPWQEMEIQAYLREFVRRKSPVIPVMLPTCPGEPILPVFLRGMTWVDFRKPDSDPLQRLVWGITGRRLPGRQTTPGDAASR